MARYNSHDGDPRDLGTPKDVAEGVQGWDETLGKSMQLIWRVLQENNGISIPAYRFQDLCIDMAVDIILHDAPVTLEFAYETCGYEMKPTEEVPF